VLDFKIDGQRDIGGNINMKVLRAPLEHSCWIYWIIL